MPNPATIPFGAPPLVSPTQPDTIPFGAPPIAKPPTPPKPSLNDSINNFLSTPAYSMGPENTSGLFGTLGKEAANIGKSGLKFAKGTFDFFNPYNTLKNLSQIPSAVGGFLNDISSAGKSIQESNILANKAAQLPSIPGHAFAGPNAQKINVPNLQDLTPSYTSAAGEAVTPKAAQLAAKGQFTNSLQSLAEDPFQLAVPLLGLKGALDIPTGGETISEESGAPKPATVADTGVGKAIDKTISTIAKPGVKTLDLAGKGVGKVADFGKTLTKLGISGVSGMSPKTINTILENPEKFFGKDYKSDYSRDAIGQKVSTAIDKRLEDLSATGKEYQAIRKSGESVKIPTTNGISTPLKNILDQFGVKINKAGKVITDADSLPMSGADEARLQRFIDTFGKRDELTANQFLNARSTLSQAAKYGQGETTAITTMNRALRTAYDIMGKDQITGLRELDEKYAPETQLLKQIKRDYLKPDGTFKDNALSRLANVTNAGKEPALARLEKISPGIGKEISVLKAVEDIANAGGQKVGTYTRTLATGAAFLKGGLPGAVAEYILTNPSLVTQVLAGWGKLNGVDISGVLNKVFNTPVKPNVGLTTEAVGGLPGAPKEETAPQEAPPEFKGFKDLSTKIIDKLKGRDVVSKQFISDLTNSGDVKQAERDLIKKTLEDFPDKVPVKDFANAVKTELLPLKIDTSERVRGMEATAEARGSRYENITLPENLRGNVANYKENIYESPIKTSAGDVHFSGDGIDNYFAHTRVEDMAPEGRGRITVADPQTRLGRASGDTRRVIELQSDLFQKGRLENESTAFAKNYDFALQEAHDRGFKGTEASDLAKKWVANEKGLSKLEPYRNTWQERIIREEIKQAAKDGKTKLQFPTGETAMKIEGLGEAPTWSPVKYENGIPVAEDILKPEQLKTGLEVTQGMQGDSWIITDVLGDGKFKAVPKNVYEAMNGFKVIKEKGGEIVVNSQTGASYRVHSGETAQGIIDAEKNDYLRAYRESFDISGKVDTNNPIYKFYEKEVGKYLKNKFGAKTITDPQGVTWNEVPIKKAQAKLPIEAFAAAPLVAKALTRKKK